MLKVIFLYLFVLFYCKLKENLKIIIEDVINVLVIPLKLISWVFWKISSIKKSSNG